MLGIAFLGLAAAGCGSPASGSSTTATSPATSAAASSASSAPSGPAKGAGPVNVLYAGSLVDMMEKQAGPGFQSSSGYTVIGFSGGSKALAAEIRGKVHAGDVFISASPKVTATLAGAKNGNWLSWYASYATSALVLGYNPSSKFAAELKSKPWYRVITEPGIKVGFTDPATDPKGALTAEALNDTAKAKSLPALAALAANTSDVFPEETLVGRLQAGQLDAGFFYVSEATAAKIATVPLTGVDLKATYTISILNNAPHEAAAEAFVAYLLGPAGQAVLKQDGFTLVSPYRVTGTGVPATLSGVLP